MNPLITAEERLAIKRLGPWKQGRSHLVDIAPRLLATLEAVEKERDFLASECERFTQQISSLGPESLVGEKLRSAFEIGEKLLEKLKVADKLLWGVVANAGHDPRPEVAKVRWALVRDAVGCGSTRAKELCEKHGFDPDEMIGGPDPGVCGECGGSGRVHHNNSPPDGEACSRCADPSEQPR